MRRLAPEHDLLNLCSTDGSMQHENAWDLTRGMVHRELERCRYVVVAVKVGSTKNSPVERQEMLNSCLVGCQPGSQHVNSEGFGLKVSYRSHVGPLNSPKHFNLVTLRWTLGRAGTFHRTLVSQPSHTSIHEIPSYLFKDLGVPCSCHLHWSFPGQAESTPLILALNQGHCESFMSSLSGAMKTLQAREFFIMEDRSDRRISQWSTFCLLRCQAMSTNPSSTWLDKQS